MQKKLLRYASYLFTALLLAGLVAAYFLSSTFRAHVQEGWRLIRQGEREAVTAFFQSFGFWGPVFILLFMFLQMITVVLPSWLLMVVAVLAYGPVWGTGLAIFGITLVAAIAYWIGQGLGEGLLARFIGTRTKGKLDRLIRQYGAGAVFLFRLSPFLSNDAVSLVAGMLGMSLRSFLLATLAGITPLAVALALFSGSPETLKTGFVWIGGAGILLYGVYIWLERRGEAR